MIRTTFLFLLLSASAALAEEPRRDLYGDPLPKGAAMRLGTVRFRHNGVRIYCTAYSPDGKYLAFGSEFGSIQLSNPQTGEQLHCLRGSTEETLALEFSADSKLLASSGNDRTLRIWDIVTGKCIYAIKQEAAVWSLVFSRDGKWIASSGDDSSIRFWDTRTGKCLQTLKGHKEADVRIELSPDGKLLASIGLGDGNICFWDTASFKLLRRVETHLNSIYGARFAPDGKLLAYSDDRGSIHLLNPCTGQQVREWKTHIGETASLVFTPKGQSLLSSGTDGIIREWDTSSGKQIRALIHGVRGLPKLNLSAGGKILYWSCGEQIVRRCDLATGRENLRPDGHEADVTSLRFADDDNTILSTANDGSVRTWNVADGKQFHCERDSEGARILALSSDGRMLAVAKEKTVRLRNRTSGKIKASFQTDVELNSLRFSPDGKILAAEGGSGGSQGLLYLWDVVARKEICRFGGRSPIFSPDSRLFAATDFEDELKIRLYFRETATAKIIREIHRADKRIIALCFSPDNRMLVGSEFSITSRGRENLVVWETVTGKERFRFERVGDNLRAAFSSDGTLLAACGFDQSIFAWEMRTGKERLHSQDLPGYTEVLAFSKNGRLLASGSSDTTILLWPISPLAGQAAHIGKELAAEKLRELWTALADADAAVAFRAMKTFSESPASTTAFLRQHLRPVPILDAETTRRLLAELDADDFAVRERATKELEKLCESAESPLRQTLREKPSLELRRRAETLLDKMMRETPERLRQRRAVELLEWLKTAESRRLLEALAGGAADAWLTQEAKASLRRMGG